MPSLSFDTCLESFSPLAWALSTTVSWKSARTLTTRGFSSGRILASYGAVVAMETVQLALNYVWEKIIET